MIKIFLVDDQCLILEAIKAILADEPEIEIVGTAQDGQSAISQILKLQPNIVLIDIEMPKMNGIEATKYISQYLSDTKVIMLTSHKSQNYITEALQAGASSYLVKDTLIEDLKQAIYSLSRGYSYVETRLLTKAVNQIQTSNIVQKKTTYIKKYRINIYSPSVTTTQASGNINTEARNNKYRSGLSKASLTPIFKSLDLDQIQAVDYSMSADFSNKVFKPFRTNGNSRRFWHKIILLFTAIISVILSIIIF